MALNALGPVQVLGPNNWFGLSHVESFNLLGIHAWHYLAATQIDTTTLPLHDLPQTLPQCAADHRLSSILFIS